MNQNSDSKGQGMPPPYTHNTPPPVIVTTHTSHAYPPQPMQPPSAQGVVYQAGPAAVIPVMVSQQPMIGPKPASITCRSCNAQIITRVELKTSTRTHLFALLLCCVFWPCVCLPYCLDSCHNADHYCPNCNAYIGSYTN